MIIRPEDLKARDAHVSCNEGEVLSAVRCIVAQLMLTLIELGSTGSDPYEVNVELKVDGEQIKALIVNFSGRSWVASPVTLKHRNDFFIADIKDGAYVMRQQVYSAEGISGAISNSRDIATVIGFVGDASGY